MLKNKKVIIVISCFTIPALQVLFFYKLPQNEATFVISPLPNNYIWNVKHGQAMFLKGSLFKLNLKQANYEIPFKNVLDLYFINGILIFKN